MKLPDSMDDLVYWTSRKIGNGNVKAWVYRGSCPKCGKAVMGKPVDNKGKVKIRAGYYECRECGFKIDKTEYEESLNCECMYTCPDCGNRGEIEFPFKRKKYKGANALVFRCQKCNSEIPIVKKMKDI